MSSRRTDRIAASTFRKVCGRLGSSAVPIDPIGTSNRSHRAHIIFQTIQRACSLPQGCPPTCLLHISGYRMLCLPCFHKTTGIAKGATEETGLRRDTLERASRSPQRVLGPVVGAERCAPGAAYKGTRYAAWSPKPTVTEFVFRRGFSHLFGVARKRFVRFSFVELLPVHVAMGSQVASLHRAIHPQGEMPRVVEILGVHSDKRMIGSHAFLPWICSTVLLFHFSCSSLFDQDKLPLVCILNLLL